MKNIMGKSEFNRRIVAFNDAAKVSRDQLNDLIMDGLLQAADVSQGGHGSCSRLTVVLQACKHVKAIPTRTVQAFIQKHANVKWMKLKDGTHGFKYSGKPCVTLPECTWYDWEGNNTSKPKVELDLKASMERLLARGDKALKEGKTVEHAELLPVIKKILAAEAAEA